MFIPSKENLKDIYIIALNVKAMCGQICKSNVPKLARITPLLWSSAAESSNDGP
jgi:hypothetical protein